MSIFSTIQSSEIFDQEPLERGILGRNQQGSKDHATAEIGEKLLVFRWV